MGWWARLAARRLVLAVGLVAGTCPAARAAGGLTLLTDQPLPMAVRDGGVAEATVRAVPFAPGTSTLDTPTAAALDAYLAAVATDCFLFAQAIGHVRPGPEGDGDTLTAHRLARARSDAVNAALLKAGLPADAVTSVWDRQFAAREPRVTLWVFARPIGDDCAGTSLPGAAAQVVVVPSRPPSAPAAVATIAQANSEPAPGIHLPELTPPTRSPGNIAPVRLSHAPPATRAKTLASEVDEIRAAAVPPVVPAHMAQVEPAPGIHLAPRSLGGRAAPRQAMRADSMSEQAVAPQPSVAVAEAVGSPTSLAASTTAADAEPEAGPQPSAAVTLAAAAPDAAVPRVEIVFEPDSSYLANGAVAQLETLLATLPRDAAWEVELQAAVGDSAGRLPTDRALAYNQWLAERRQSRVEDWLGARSEGPVLRVRRSKLAHDPSRRVVVSARPLP
jgi:hypothetical protein